MKNITPHTGTIENLKRLPSSSNGNPRYSFRIDGYTVVTAPNCMLGYEIKNYEDRLAKVSIGRHYGKLTLNTLTKVI